MTPPTRQPPSTLAVVAALLTVYLVWGSTYLAIAVMIRTLPPLLAAGVRYAVAGLLMFGLLWLRNRLRRADEPPERATGRHWRSAFIIGGLLLLGGNGFVVLSEQRIPSGVAAVIVATVPIWLAVLDAILTGRRPSRLVVGGIGAGLTGVAILLAPIEGLDRIDPIGVAMVLFAAFSWACGSLYARGAALPRSGLLGTGMEMLAGGLVLIGAGTLIGEIGRAEPSAFSLDSLAALAYLVVFGSILAFTAYTWLLANVPVSTVGTYAYVNPIVAVGLGALILSEPITLRTVLATAIIIGAVVAMVSGRPRQAEAPGPEPAAAPAEPRRRGAEPAARASVQTER